ncbi:MAG: ATP-binding protein, partial [Methanobacteriota archaeon]
MREKVGLIFGTVGSTRFRLGVQDARLRRGDYVQVKHETDGWVVGQVFDITRESSLSLEEVARSAVPGARDERLSAEVLVIGYRDRRGYVQPPRTPFRPGETVFRADEGLLAEVLGLAGVQGAYVGMIKGHDVRVELEINGLVQKHVSVLAKTGAGKSYVVGVLMEELLKRNVPLVVVDPHGEHSSLSSPNKEGADHGALRRFGVKPRGYAEQVIEYSPDTQVNPNAVRLTLDGTNLDARELSELVGAKLSNAQAGLLHQAVRKLSERGRDYALDDIVEEVRRNQSALKWNLISALEYLQDLRLFDEVGTPITALVKRGQATVVNLRGSAPDIQDIVVSRLTRSLFEERKRNRIPPCMLVVEEAHHFCPERTFGAALAGDILRTVASEGRKFGLGLCVVTQRPAKVDKNVLSQCNTQFVLKVTNPNDLKAIVASVEGLGTEWEAELQRLPVGVAIVTSPSVAVPLFVEI